MGKYDYRREGIEVPYGFCGCGCGQRAPIANRNFHRMGILKGEPFRFISGHNSRRNDAEYAEENRGYETPCWIWQFATERNGYGRKVVQGVKYGAHRYYYEQQVRPLQTHEHLHHLCGIRACVRPDHLQVLSPAEHYREHRALLTVEQVREIKAQMSDEWGRCSVLARRFGVHPKTINDIKLGKTWAEV